MRGSNGGRWRIHALAAYLLLALGYMHRIISSVYCNRKDVEIKLGSNVRPATGCLPASVDKCASRTHELISPKVGRHSLIHVHVAGQRSPTFDFVRDAT